MTTAHTDEFSVMDNGRPCAVRAFELCVGSAAAQVLDEYILHIGARIGEPPGDVRVAAADNERNAGQRKAGYVEAVIVEVQSGLVPDVGDEEAEVHVV